MLNLKLPDTDTFFLILSVLNWFNNGTPFSSTLTSSIILVDLFLDKDLFESNFSSSFLSLTSDLTSFTSSDLVLSIT